MVLDGIHCSVAVKLHVVMIYDTHQVAIAFIEKLISFLYLFLASTVSKINIIIIL